MTWVNKFSADYGMATNMPTHRSAFFLLNEKTENKILLNCRCCAIILNDIFLSLGIKSKFITCRAKDPYDPECHVTNNVYIPELNKWILIDSAIQAIIMNIKGEFLGVQELRKYIKEEEQIVFMKNLKVKNLPLNNSRFEKYLAKNLYCFSAYSSFHPYCDNELNNKLRYMLIPTHDNLYKNAILSENIMFTDNAVEFFS